MSFKIKDHYYKKAKKDNYLARSVYKLEELDNKYNIMKQGDQIIDLGYHPGSWSQYCAKKIGNTGQVIGIDIKPINKQLLTSQNITIFQKDIFEISSVTDLGLNQKVNVVISDMAPNTTGIKSVDQIKSLNLVEMVFELLPILLIENGNFVIKVFDGNDAQSFLKSQRKRFSKFNYFRPKSTRTTSKEFFVTGTGFQG
ncbi:MAG: RlmE family RNA methyltransferase [Bdellovibrionales bacterium]|nr:RlmE family RNA methyltransferase [Bdellovibrionales bacterium]